MFRVEMLPGGHGDSLWIEYGKASAPKRILIDCGTPGSYKHVRDRIQRLDPDDRKLELLVVTHIDGDHIGGAINLLNDKDRLGVSYGDIWFNGWDHIVKALKDDDLLGARQAEIITLSIERRDLPWNRQFDSEPVMADEEPSVIHLDDDLSMTLLSPTREQFRKLQPVWLKELKAAGLIDEDGNLVEESEKLEGAFPLDDLLGPRPEFIVEDLIQNRFAPDGSKANGCSIAFILQHGNHRCLFTGDAHAPVLVDSLSKLPASQRKFDMVKLPHHGSKANVNDELMELIESPRYLVSTDGKVFNHPDPEAMARVVHFNSGSELFFNYRNVESLEFDSEEAREQADYEPHYPPVGTEGLAIDL